MTLAEVEFVHILKTLRLNSYNRTHTAIALDIGLRTLQRKLKHWDVNAVFSDSELFAAGVFEMEVISAQVS